MLQTLPINCLWGLQWCCPSHSSHWHLVSSPHWSGWRFINSTDFPREQAFGLIFLFHFTGCQFNLYYYLLFYLSFIIPFIYLFIFLYYSYYYFIYPLLFLLLFYLSSIIPFIYYFIYPLLFLSFCLLCTYSFHCFLKWEPTSLIENLFFFLIQTFKATSYPLTTALARTHKF